MKISCNRLKTYIKNSENIDWLKVWNLFAIRTAEVEEVVIKGMDIEDVIVGEVISLEKHPKKDNYSIAEVSDGIKTYTVLCGAPNIALGGKYPYVREGGKVSGFKITKKEIAGVISEGMLCSGDELGINSDKDGILELPFYYQTGADIKELLPIEDIVIEIDNKSLTNRPDLWGHYGIAREIAAITNNELLPLEQLKVDNNLKDLDIKINNPKYCNRFTAIEINNIKTTKSPLEMQIFLHYVDMRSISLLVDLTNFVMLETAQPMHAYSLNKVSKIIVDTNKEEIKFKTLDGISRFIKKDTLLISNEKEPIGIAGIMGGLDSETKDNDMAIFLEAANFDATSIRRTSINLGLRTEASARFEKSLDPSLTELSIKRFLYLLKEIDEGAMIGSNLTDLYPVINEEKVVVLKKEKLNKYMGFVLDDAIVRDILKRLEFVVEIKNDEFIVSIPSFRRTKDISYDVDIIEEISRMYGYENIKEKPLVLENNFDQKESIYDLEMITKSFLTHKYNAHEVHSYFLKRINIVKDNVKVVNKKENNILRDEMTLSLLPFVEENFKNFDNFILYEIGTIIKDNLNKRVLCILLAGRSETTEDRYFLAKKIVSEYFYNIKNIDIHFVPKNAKGPFIKDYLLDIYVGDDLIGKINIVSPDITYEIAKNKSIISVEIDFDKFIEIKEQKIKVKEVSLYPEVELDYTIIMDKKYDYDYLEVILKEFKHDYIIDYKLVDYYKTVGEIKYSVRYRLGSFIKTLNQKELLAFKDEFISYINSKNLKIIE